MANIASWADSGQWQSTSTKFSSPLNTRETKRELREARSGYRITRPRGIRGWLAYKDRDRTRAIKRWGIYSPRRWRQARARIPLLEYTTLSISRPTVSLRDLFVLQIQPNIARISFFLFFSLLFPRARLSKQISTWLNIIKFFLTNLHRNLTPIIGQCP
jgi:hypothetical protein